MLRSLRSVVTQPHLLALVSVGVVLIVATEQIRRETYESSRKAIENAKKVAENAEETAKTHGKIREIIDRLQNKWG